LGFLYSDLAEQVMDRERLKQIVYSVIIYVLQFDLLAPPYDQVEQVTVGEMNALSAYQPVSTGKRLGFRFKTDMEELT
jgi:hypothetical protein